MSEIEELTQRVEKIEARQSGEKEILKFGQAAEFLGFSKDYLYKLCYRKQIPFHQPTNKSIFFLKSELIKWITGGKKNKKPVRSTSQKKSGGKK